MSEMDRLQADQLSVEAAFAELRQHLLDDGSLTETLALTAALTQRVVPEATEVSVTLVEGKRPRTAAFTGQLAVQLDERQYETGFGPCLGAATSGQTIRTRTDDPESPYPDFIRAARRGGIRHTLSVAMPVSGRVIGALNLYGAGDQIFSEQSAGIVATFAGYAAVTIVNKTLYADAVELARQLGRAMDSRAVIEQAKGILMAQHGCTADEGFAMLARQSQTRNVKLRDLAETVVQRAALGGRRRAP